MDTIVSALPPTTYAPNLRTYRPFAVHYRAINGEHLREFAASEERDAWLATDSGRVDVLAVLNRTDPASVPLCWRSTKFGGQDSRRVVFQADVAKERQRPQFASWRRMHLDLFRERGELVHLADAAYCAAVVDAAVDADLAAEHVHVGG